MSNIHRTTIELFIRGADQGHIPEERRAVYEQHLASCPDCQFNLSLYGKLQAGAALVWPASISPQRSKQQLLDGINAHICKKRRQKLLF